jgi:hypothetical protein
MATRFFSRTSASYFLERLKRSWSASLLPWNPMPTQADTIFAALQEKVGFQVVQFSESPRQLRVVGRIPPDSLMRNEGNWKALMFRIKTAEEQRPWTADLSKWYFIKKEVNRLVFAHRILLQGEDIVKHYADFANIIRTSPEARREVTEIPLGGAGRDRNNPAGGRRGAGPSGTVPVGPMAVMQKMRGG